MGILKKTPQEFTRMIQETRTPIPKVWNMVSAFLVGGTICAIGQALNEVFIALGFSKEESSTIGAVILVFLSALLTGIGWYDEISQIGGAGAAVPITGFANAVVSPAMEFRQDGFVMGMGARLFFVAGPVLVYGMVSAFVVGLFTLLFGV